MVSQYVLGIDVGTSAVKALVADISSSPFIDIKGSGVVPARGISKGNIVEAAALVTTIREAADCALMAGGITAAPAVIGIGGKFLRSFGGIGSVAPVSPLCIDKSDIIKACRAAAITTVPDDYAVLDVIPIAYWVDGDKTFQDPAGRKGSRIEVEVHITAMPQAIHAELQSRVEEAGIEVLSFSANAVAGAYCLAPAARDACLYMDVGAGVTDIAIFYQSQLRLSASLPLGGDYITNDIMHGLSIGRAHAEEVKRYYNKLDKQSLQGRDILLDCNDYGTKDKKVAFSFLHDIIESRVQEIVALTHQYLSPALHAYQPQSIWLTGGSSFMQSLIDACEKQFQLPVVRFAPQISREYAHPANTVCYGLIQTVAAQADTQPTAAHSEQGLLAKLKNLFKSDNRG